MNKDIQDNVIKFREYFAKLPQLHQTRELSRLNRIVEHRLPIFVEPLDDDSRRFKFDTPTDVIDFIRSQGIEVKSNSNIYKCLRKQRAHAYGYKIYYGKE